MSDTANKFVQLFIGAEGKAIEDKRNRLGTGIVYEAEVRIAHVEARVETDEAIRNAGHVEEFVIQGRWDARVRKENFQLGRMFDSIWSPHVRPYGFFEIAVKALDGDMAGEPGIKVTVEDRALEPNQYALKAAELLVTKKLEEIAARE